MKNEHLERYFDMLGVTSSATLDDINSAYMELIERLPENPTEEQEEEQRKLKHAYDILRRAYIPTKPKAPKATGVYSRYIVPLGLVLVLVLGGVLAYMHRGAIQMAVTHYERGEVLRWQNEDAPYGTIIRFDKEHQFRIGNPDPAYQLQLHNGEETIWLSERLVVKGMVPVEGGDVSAAGVGTPSN